MNDDRYDETDAHELGRSILQTPYVDQTVLKVNLIPAYRVAAGLGHQQPPSFVTTAAGLAPIADAGWHGTRFRARAPEKRRRTQ